MENKVTMQITENTDLARLQLKFSSKPQAEVISALKKNGWHWSPRESAWQRKLTDNARKDAEALRQKFFPETNKKKSSLEKTLKQIVKEDKTQDKQTETMTTYYIFAHSKNGKKEVALIDWNHKGDLIFSARSLGTSFINEKADKALANAKIKFPDYEWYKISDQELSIRNQKKYFSEQATKENPLTIEQISDMNRAQAKKFQEMYNADASLVGITFNEAELILNYMPGPVEIKDKKSLLLHHVDKGDLEIGAEEALSLAVSQAKAELMKAAETSREEYRKNIAQLEELEANNEYLRHDMNLRYEMEKTYSQQEVMSELEKMTDKLELEQNLRGRYKVEFVEKIAGEPFEPYRTDPKVFASYGKNGKVTGLLINDEVARIMLSHKEPSILDWKDAIADDISKKYTNIEKQYIRESLAPLRMGYKDGRKEKVMISYGQEQERTVQDNTQTQENGQSEFDNALDAHKAGQLPDGYIFNLGKPGEILQKCGFPEHHNIELAASHLKYKINLKRHPFTTDDIKGLDKALQNPVAVFEYGDKTKSQNVIVELQKDGKNFLAGVHFNQKRDSIEVSSVRGIFPKDNIEWTRWIEHGKMIYGDKEKIQVLIDQQQMNFADVTNADARSSSDTYYLDSVSSILQEFGDVKQKFT